MTGDEVLQQADEHRVRFVRLQFTDILGVLKNVVISRRDLPRALERGIPFDGSSVEGFVRMEESDMVLRADAGTWCIFPWSDPDARTARLICQVHHPDGRPYECCPRQVLQRMRDEARKLGYSLQAGPEVEFFLFLMDDHGRPTTQTHDRGSYFDLSPVDQGELARREMVLTLEEMGLVYEASHHENSPGQHEIRFAPAEALVAADNVMTVRHVVRRVAARHGLHATFMPKPIFGMNGSGMHMYLTLHRNGRNAFAGRPATLLQFVAGLLRHGPAMAAVTNPLVNSYKRLVPGFEAPVRAGWSAQNRSPMVRIPAGPGAATAVELRLPDGACNPYLALAVILQAGLEGVRQKLLAPPPLDQDPSGGGPDAGAALPRNLLEAMAALEQDEVVQGALGAHLCRRYVAAKRVEWDVFHSHVHTWEIDEYLARY